MASRNFIVTLLFAAVICIVALIGLSGRDAAAQTRPGTPPTRPTPPPPPTAPATAPSKSLFERLGGTYAIASVVDDLTERLAADPVITANPAVKESLSKISVPGLKFQLTAFVIQAVGGPYQYHGKDMKTAHANLKISGAEWDAAVADLKATLAKFNVPQREQEELLRVVASTKNDIVTNSSSAH